VDPKEPLLPELGYVGTNDYISDLKKEIAKLKLKEPPIIMGHSYGALLTQILASQIKIKAFVLLTPVPPYGIWIWRARMIRIFAKVLMQWGFWRKPFRFNFSTAVYAMMKLFPPAKQKKYFKKLRYEAGRAACETGFWFFDPYKATRVDEKKVTAPGLVIGGGKDNLMPLFLSRRIAKKYRHVVDYKEYPEHAHWIIDEPGWEKVAEDIYRWLKNII